MIFDETDIVRVPPFGRFEIDWSIRRAVLTSETMRIIVERHKPEP
jgi:hypothetical protein